MIFTQKFNTPLGEMIAASIEEGICLLEFTDSGRHKISLAEISKNHGGEIVGAENCHLADTKLQLAEYFTGARKEFTVPVVTFGTDFQKKVWHGLLKIPYGSTISYSDQASATGSREAVRAVARTNGMNRIAIILPCHRVVGHNGKLTGYSGGLERKRWLLDHERKNSTIIEGELRFGD